MNNLKDLIASLDELIDKAPEAPESPEFGHVEKEKEPRKPELQVALDGWDQRWKTCNTSPTGDSWLTAFDKAKRVIERGSILILHGTRGAGKTRMAYESAISTNLPKDKTGHFDGIRTYRKTTAKYTTAMGFFLDVRATFTKKANKTERDIVDSLTDPALLVIDEIQERSESAWENRLLTHVLDSRYSSMRPTIIIANLTSAELAASLGPSIMDRIHEGGGHIEFTWPSYRRA
jgi:DNA replication protein DnaC